MAWTRFVDMHSGGGAKEKFEYLYLEAPQEEAEVIFYNRFGHSPNRVSCTCCGEDYSVSEKEDLAQLTGYDRNCEYEGDRYVETPRTKYNYGDKKVTPLEEYLKQKDVAVIRKEEIKTNERTGRIPRQGYVWVEDGE